MIPVVLIILAAALIYFALDLRRLSTQKAAETGVTGSILYSDADHQRVSENLSCDLGSGIKLVGKPDYILRQEGKIIPLEFKSGKGPQGRLYAGYEIQVGAYFLLIESRYGAAAAPPHGIVRFADGKTFQVENSPDLRRRVIDAASSMAAIQRGAEEGHRKHRSAGMCAACKFFPVCDERLN